MILIGQLEECIIIQNQNIKRGLRQKNPEKEGCGSKVFNTLLRRLVDNDHDDK